MAEIPDGDDAVSMETLRSRLNQLFKSVGTDTFNNDDRSSISESYLEDGIAELLKTRSEIDLEDKLIASLDIVDSESILSQLKEELNLVEDECSNTEEKIMNLMRAIHEDSAKLYGDLVALDLLFKTNKSEDADKPQGPMLGCRSSGGEHHDIMTHASCEDDNFEVFQLDHQIEKANNNLSQLQALHSVYKRNEALGQILEVLSEDVKPIEFEGNCIRLSIRTPVFSSDVSLLGQKLDCVIEPTVVYHELVVEVEDETMELKNVEIFPNDVCLDNVIAAAKLSRQSFCLHTEAPIKSPFEWLVRNVKQQIFICNVRRIVVKDANKSRHSFEYTDKDETVIAHLVGGIDAFIKISLGWPISTTGLHLISIKGLNIHSKGISLDSLYKIKERANSLDAAVRHHLPHFADAIEEILLQELHQKS